jgi:hypothetical protein
LGRFISRDPKEYIDGYSMYRAYFAPNMVDPSGFGATGIEPDEPEEPPEPRPMPPITTDPLPPVSTPADCEEAYKNCMASNPHKRGSGPRARSRKCRKAKTNCMARAHTYRNRRNECPQQEPTPGVPDSRGRKWKADNPAGESMFHCGYECYRHCNFQCCYEKGVLVTSGGGEGTYDYTAHFEGEDCGESGGTGSHFDDDVWPHGPPYLPWGDDYETSTVVY